MAKRTGFLMTRRIGTKCLDGDPRMEIKQLDNNREFDVFVGKGWSNWVRVKYTSSKVEVIKSSFQPSETTLELIYYKIKKKFFSQPKGGNKCGS